MTDKITVHTEHGPVSIGDECELLNSGKRVNLIDIDTKIIKRFTVSWTSERGEISTCETEHIRPVQKPKPLEGMELYEKLLELGLKGWSWKLFEGGSKEQPIISILSFKEGEVFIDNGQMNTTDVLRAPRSTEWIRAVDVTEETGR